MRRHVIFAHEATKATKKKILGENESPVVIASEARQSSSNGGTGLPRFARNDDVGLLTWRDDSG